MSRRTKRNSTRGSQFQNEPQAIFANTEPEIVADTRQVILKAIACMGSRAPVIDLPNEMRGETPLPWEDEKLQWLLRESWGGLSNLPE